MINWLMVLVAFSLMPLLFSTGAASARDLSLKEILPRNFAYYPIYNARAVAVDTQGNFYVSSVPSRCILKISSTTGAILATWGSPGSGDGQLYEVWGAVVDGSGNVHITDRQNGRVQKFDANGVYLAQWGNGQVGDARGMARDSSGNLYVAD